MRRVLLSSLGLIALNASTAWASDSWIVYKGEGGAWAYDAGDLVSGSDKGLAVATFATYNAAQGKLEGTAYHYAVTKTVFHCSAATVRVGEVSLYDDKANLVRKFAAGPNAPARPVDSPEVDRISKLLFSIGCGGGFPPSGGVQATSLANAMQRMKS
jgi:hypothetical protein